jgi:hypothetical protein
VGPEKGGREEMVKYKDAEIDAAEKIRNAKRKILIRNLRQRRKTTADPSAPT